MGQFSFFAMFMVRPHIATVMLIAYIVYFIINSKIHVVLKLLTLPIIAFGILLSISFVQQYIGLDDANIDSLDSYVQTRQSYGQDTGSGSYVDISSMSYPMKMFTYSFRPLPFKAHSLVAFISSLENTILLLVFIYIVFKLKFNLKPFVENRSLWLFTYVLFSLEHTCDDYN
ncbi:hypothetical protein ACTXLR_09570 [Psychrobacter faecalis]|uniref:hypothetical protein n=1 Tax=Psychrobacter faecalis TaxID=180588 RepID=UPI003FD33C3C